jgi:hypothetical protein
MAGEELFKDRIAAAFAADGYEDHLAQDLAFHMTDWNAELEQLSSLYRNIDSVNDEEISRVIFRFLAHAPNHIAAAKKLIGFGPIEDIFGVGVLEEDED